MFVMWNLCLSVWFTLYGIRFGSVEFILFHTLQVALLYESLQAELSCMPCS